MGAPTSPENATAPPGPAGTAPVDTALPTPARTATLALVQDHAARVDAVAAAVLACPLVVALSGGQLGEVASYLPGRRVQGVRLGAATVTVHVVARYAPVAEIAAQVRQAVSGVTGPLPVTVGVDDLALDAPTRRG